MPQIDPGIWNYEVRSAIKGYMGAGIPYKINTHTGKVHSFDHGREKVESITQILAIGNMRKEEERRGNPFASATFNPAL